MFQYTGRQICRPGENEERIENDDADTNPEPCIGKNIYPLVHYYFIERGNAEKNKRGRINK